MINAILSLYKPSYVRALVYMLQSTEYKVGPYLKWYWRTQDFSKVETRRKLDRTKAARLLLIALKLGIGLELVAGLVLITIGLTTSFESGIYYGIAVIIAYPVVWAHLVIIPLLIGRWFITVPKEYQLIKESEQIFAKHPGIKIAVAGSYGKTSMKELLLTVLSEGRAVAATPANKNVGISHAWFANSLKGDEDILVIEYGEGAPRDVEHFAQITHPTHAVITGLAPAHLDRYKTLDAAGADIFSVATYLKGENVYVNSESAAIKKFLKKSYVTYDRNGALGWKVSNIRLAVDHTQFKLSKGKSSLNLKSGLLGKHNVSSLALVVALALEFGLSEKQVKAGVAKTTPFEHRMHPYQTNGGWIIDDSYNGNIEGVKAGTELLKDLKFSHKTYVTPGLVDQGKDTASVHRQMGELIAKAKPDDVVLMKNSATKYIKEGLDTAGFKGNVRVEAEPVKFYNNINYQVAAGHVLMMQNDWTDNYA